MTVGGGYIYWANEGFSQESIGRARVEGSEVDQDVISTHTMGLPVYDHHIYWPR